MRERRGTGLHFAASKTARRPVTALAAVISVVVLGTALAGCSSSGGGASGGGTSVTVGKAVDTIGFTTVDVAQSKGYFAKQGVQVKSELLGGSSTAFAALQSGSVQFVAASSTALLKAKAKGLPLQAVTGLDYGVSLQMIASKSWIKDHHLSPNQPLNTVMKGLVGATIGVISSTDLTFNQYLMNQAGVDKSKFKFITLKTQAAALAALQHNEINAFLLSPPNSYLAESQDTAQIVATLHSVPLLRGMTYDVLVVDSDYAKKHPDTVRSVATAVARADNLMAKDPKATLAAEHKHYPSMSDKVLLQSLRYVTFSPDGKMTQKGWQDAKTEAVSTDVGGASKVSVAPGGVWTNAFIKSGDV